MSNEQAEQAEQGTKDETVLGNDSPLRLRLSESDRTLLCDALDATAEAFRAASEGYRHDVHVEDVTATLVYRLGRETQRVATELLNDAAQKAMEHAGVAKRQQRLRLDLGASVN